MSAQPKKAEPKEHRLAHLNGSLLNVPLYEPHYRGANWLAVIDVDGTLPGGLSRRFVPRGKGESCYLIEQLGLFDAIEFGADYTTSVGRKKPNRLYGVVVAITPTEIVVREAPTGATACLEAQRARTSPADKIRALEEAHAAYLASAAKLNEQIIALKCRRQGGES